MKKFMQAAIFIMAVVFTSCSKEEVLEFACETARETLKEETQTAIDSYNNNQTATACEAVKTAVQTYKDSECGDSTFDSFLDSLPEDCSTVVIDL